VQAFTLQFAGGSGAAAGAAAGGSVAACAAPDDADGLGVRPGAIIGAPKFAVGAVGAGGLTGAEIFGWTGAGATGGAGVFGTATVALLGAGGNGGALALNPALVSTIGDMGADTQSSPSSTLPSAIASTNP